MLGVIGVAGLEASKAFVERPCDLQDLLIMAR